MSPTRAPNLLMMKKYKMKGKLTSRHVKLPAVLAVATPDLVARGSIQTTMTNVMIKKVPRYSKR